MPVGFGLLATISQRIVPHCLQLLQLTEREHPLCRLWDLNVSKMGDNFMGATLSDVLEAWVNAKLQDVDDAASPFCNPAGVLMLPGIIARQDDLLTALAKMTH